MSNIRHKVKMNVKCLAVVLSGSLLVPAAAQAQSTPDIQDAINRTTQIDEALREQRRTTAQPGERSGSEIDGEAGVYVITVNDIFYVGASAGNGWAENPLRTIDDVGDSLFVSGAASLGVQTQLAGKVDAGIAASVSGIEYEKSFAPSSRTVTGSANIGMPIAGTPIYVGLGGYGGKAFDSSFENGSGFYGVTASATGRILIGQRALAVIRVNGGRQLNDVKENNAWNAVGNLSLTYLLSERVALGAEAELQRSWYDDFYEDVTFVERRDWQYGANVNASWSPTPWLAVSAAVGYSERDSAFFLSNYDGFEASLTISARKRF